MKLKYRCKKFYCNDREKHRILSEKKAISCASRGCPWLQSFIEKGDRINARGGILFSVVPLLPIYI